MDHPRPRTDVVLDRGGNSGDTDPIGKLLRPSFEFNLTEHCNLGCYACGHASPLLPTKFASVEEFSCDLDALARVFHSEELRIVGGEPLLHPRLLDFLTEARRIAIADKIVVYTNGVLLHRVPSRFWELIDQLLISAYPGVARRLTDYQCAEICRAHNVDLQIRYINEFGQTMLGTRISEPELVAAIYRGCKQRAEWSCHTVYEGRFYKCPVAPFTGPRLALKGVPFDNVGSDGVALHDNPSLYSELRRYLDKPEPLAACSYCLGDVGPSVAHHQRNRKGRLEWAAEDNSADIEITRARLLRHDGTVE